MISNKSQKILVLVQPIAAVMVTGCYCGAVKDATPYLVDHKDCNTACIGEPQSKCGSKSFANAFHTGWGGE